VLLHRQQLPRAAAAAPLLQWRLRLQHPSLQLKQVDVVVAARLIRLRRLPNRRRSLLLM
jgi:hypothetical protein